MEEVTALLLIRHAANDALRDGWLPGRKPGLHLNAEGRQQALALAERLATVSLAAVCSSPLERALETAEPLAARQGLSVTICPELTEADAGRWTGEQMERLRRRSAWRALWIYPTGSRPPGGESAWEMQVRMVGALEEIRRAFSGKTVAVVSHADPIRVAVAHYLGLPLDLYRRLAVSPASVTTLLFGGPYPYPRLVGINDTGAIVVS